MEFSIELQSSPEDVFEVLTDFKNFPQLLPRQLKNVEILDTIEDKIHTKETLVFKTIVKNEIIQECIHKIDDKEIFTEIISGPAKNSKIHLAISEISKRTRIDVDIDIKLSLKALVLLPIIKKVYKNLLTGICIKIDDKIAKCE